MEEKIMDKYIIKKLADYADSLNRKALFIAQLEKALQNCARFKTDIPTGPISELFELVSCNKIHNDIIDFANKELNRMKIEFDNISLLNVLAKIEDKTTGEKS
jgi:hypothetical protein